MPVATLLFLGANASDTIHLRLGAELRDVQRALQITCVGEVFRLVAELAVRPSDLQSLLLMHAPNMLHFCGHGSDPSRGMTLGHVMPTGKTSREFVPMEDAPLGMDASGGLVLEDEQGNAVAVRPDVLTALLAILKRDIPLRCVVLNACFTAFQARAIANHVDCVIATTREVDDNAAIAFSTAFYRAIAFGKSVASAFELGRIEVGLRGLPGEGVFQLFHRPQVEPQCVFLVEPQVTLPNSSTSPIDALGSRQVIRPKNSILYRMISSPKDAIGHIFQQYRILEFLGQGGTGVCYRVQHATIGRELCLKLTYPLAGQPQAILRAVSRMVRALGAIDHSGVIKLRDFGVMEIEGESTFYLGMDLLSRHTVASWALEEKPPLAKILDTFATIADALHAGHTCRFFDETGFEQIGLLHGDIKPANIIMTRFGEPVVTDFMMPDLHALIAHDAKECLPNDVGPRRLATTDVFGTRGYMPPEQMHQGLVTVRSDIFSFGLTTVETILRRYDEWHETAEVETLIELGIDDAFGMYLSRMMHPRPEERPSSMEQVANRFREFARQL
jgi:hypothetical protein